MNMKWLALGITLILGVGGSLLRVAQQIGTETTCPPRSSNSFCTLYGKDQKISSNIAFSPNGQLVAVALRQDNPFKTIIRVWKIDGQILYELQGHEGVITSISFSPDGKLLASSSLAVNPSGYGGVIKLWDISTGKEIRALQPPNGVNGPAIVFSPNGKFLASTACILQPPDFTCAQSDIILWDPFSGAEVRRISQAYEDRILDLAFISDELLAASSIGVVMLWHVPTGRLARVLVGRGGFITASPDRRLLVVTDKSDVAEVWNVADGKQLGSIRFGRILGPSFTPDGRFLGGGEIFSPEVQDKHMVQIWRVKERIEDWQVARILSIPLPQRAGYGLTDLVFSPNGDLMAIGGYSRFSDAMVQIWYIKDLQ